MTIDIEPNDTMQTARKSGYLSLFGGNADATAMGTVSAADPADYFEFTHSKTLKQVKASLSFGMQDSLALLREGGVFGLVETVSVKGMGSFSGAGVDVRILLGYDAVAEKYEAAVQTAADALLAMTSAWVAAGGEDDTAARVIGNFTDAFAATGALFEADGANVDAKEVLAAIEAKASSLISSSSALTAFASAMREVLNAWDTPRYFVRDASGNETEVTTLSPDQLSTIWNVASTSTKGYLAVEGRVEVSASSPDLAAAFGNPTFDYSATVAVQTEVSGKPAKAGNTIQGTNRADILSEVATAPGQKKATPFDDTIKGNGGNDVITGGLGADKLYGGSGSDTFVYRTLLDSTPDKAGMDIIFDLSKGDRIDLKAIDARDATPKNDAFAFIDKKAFSGKAGELRYEKQASDTYIYADVDGDGTADFAIHIEKALTLTRDFLVL